MDKGKKENETVWQNDLVFEDEPLPLFLLKDKSVSNLPAPLADARRLEKDSWWQSRNGLFLKQARLLENYEDDFEYSGDPVRYYPTYQSLSDNELRGYFSWRARVRAGEFIRTNLSFIFLYIYELINQIGVASPEDGYEKLLEISRIYGSQEPKITSYLGEWLGDYIVYYNLDPALLEDTVQKIQDKCVAVLENITNESQDAVIDAVKQLAPKWLGRSKFYASYYEDMDSVIYNVLKEMAAHYDKSCKHPFIEQFFGFKAHRHVQLFKTAVFCNPLGRISYEYKVDEQFSYKCEDGIWSCRKRAVTPRGLRKFEKLLKTIDSAMRDAYGFGYPVNAEIHTKWIGNVIREETAAFLARKNAAKKNEFVINFGMLDKIRADALSTQEKLVVEEEKTEEPAANSQLPAAMQADGPVLSADERRFLSSLLNDGELDWLKEKGVMLSVLVDSINEKLFEIFEDSVIDDSPAIIEDYVEELKELVGE